MKRLGIAGAVWLIAAGFAIAITLIFRIDPVQWVVTMAVGVVAAVLGLWLIARPSSSPCPRRTSSPWCGSSSMPCSPCSSPTSSRHGSRTSP